MIYGEPKELINHLLWLTEQNPMVYARNKLLDSAAHDLESLDLLHCNVALDEPHQQFILQALRQMSPFFRIGMVYQPSAHKHKEDIPEPELMPGPSYLLPGLGRRGPHTPCIRIWYGRTYQLLVRYHTQTQTCPQSSKYRVILLSNSCMHHEDRLFMRSQVEQLLGLMNSRVQPGHGDPDAMFLQSCCGSTLLCGCPVGFWRATWSPGFCWAATRNMES